MILFLFLSLFFLSSFRGPLRRRQLEAAKQIPSRAIMQWHPFRLGVGTPWHHQRALPGPGPPVNLNGVTARVRVGCHVPRASDEASSCIESEATGPGMDSDFKRKLCHGPSPQPKAADRRAVGRPGYRLIPPACVTRRDTAPA
eukprot:3549895-Rhodomonas_salina.1